MQQMNLANEEMPVGCPEKFCGLYSKLSRRISIRRRSETGCIFLRRFGEESSARKASSINLDDIKWQLVYNPAIIDFLFIVAALCETVKEHETIEYSCKKLKIF